MKTKHCSNIGFRLARWLARVCLLIGLTLFINSDRAQAAVAIEVLGTGTGALLGGDLTDPENDGNEDAGPDDPSWNWKSITSNNEPGFQGGEFSYNVFDNVLGPGNAKWCCDDATEETPRNITVEFKDRIRLTHFTVSSANDVPNRDPLKWQIQGSNDGLTFEPIYVRDSDESLWPDRLQVVKFTLDNPAKPYRFIRFECTYTEGNLYQVGEIEYFGKVGGDIIIEIVGTGTAALLGRDLTDPENDGSEAAGPEDPSWNWKAITSNNEPGFGGGEFSFNIFDNVLGGGNDKWCCDDATAATPRNVTVEFVRPVSLTHFTISSANDAAGRDPVKFQIQGSTDGTAFTPIFVRDGGPSLWTARLQVVRISLAEPSPLYKFIRYEATETPDPLHQLGEIEYFGTYGGASIAAVSGVTQTVASFAVRVTDGKNSSLDPASVKLNLDGQTVTTTLSKTADLTTITYTPASPFPPLSAHIYDLTAKDTQGNAVNQSGKFTTANYALLTADMKVTNADTSKPGFVWNVFQNSGNTANTNARAEDQLAGRTTLQNQADASAQGSARAPGVAGPNGLISFEIETVINLDQAGGGNGAFTPDDQMPGIPGVEGSTDGISGEALTYIELPKGMITMGVNSDDGFRVTAGRVRDALGAVFAGEFNGGRGAADTLFPIYVEEAGVYEFRCIWEEGGGGANIEWFILKPGGTTKVLINDVANGGPKAYRARAAGPTPVLARKALPSPGQSGVAPDVDITVELVDATTAAVDRSTVTMKLDGNSVTPKVDKAANITTIVLASTGSLAANSNHAIELTFKAGTATETRKWSFTVANYATLPVALGTVLGSGTASQPGFRIRTHQVDTGQANTDSRGENQLRGLLPDPNVADLSLAQGGFFTEPGVVNFNQDAPGAVGNFTVDNGNEDKPIYGIPGTSGSTDNLAQEVLTYVEFPKAGTYYMGVNSDDGFKVTAAEGYSTNAVRLGIFDGGRGAADTIFFFNVEQAGVYPMRLIWYEGGGGANVEWFMVDKAGTKVLLNDSKNPAIGLKSFRARTNTPLPTQQPAARFTKIARNPTGTVTVEWTGGGTLQAAPAVTGPWQDVPGAASPYTFSPTAPALFGRIRN